MSKHKLISFLLFFTVYFVAIANSFISDIFSESRVTHFSISQLINAFFLTVLCFYNFFNADSIFWKFLSPLLLLAIYGLISALWSPFSFIAIVFSLKLFFIVNVFILSANLTIRNLLTEEKLLFLAKGVIMITVAGQVVGHLLGVTTYNSEFSTAGLSDNSSTISGQLLFALPAIFIGNFKKRTDLIFILLIIFSNIFTLRRSTYLSLLLVLAIVFIVNFVSSSGSTKKKLRWLVISLVITILVVLFMTSTPVGQVFLTRLAELNPNQGGTASGRYNFQYSGFIYSLQRDLISMLFGGGFGYSIVVNVNNGFIPIGMHSDFLDIFIGLGIIGLGMFFWFLKRLWDLIRKNTMGGPYFNASISFFLAITTLGFFSGGFFEMKTMLGYMSLGLIYARYSNA